MKCLLHNFKYFKSHLRNEGYDAGYESFCVMTDVTSSNPTIQNVTT